MQYKSIIALSSLLSLAAAKPRSVKRDNIAYSAITWGPMIELGPTADGVTITSVVATIFPGNMPTNQAGGLYNWIGVNNETETGDLIQGIVGSYSEGQGECTGEGVDTLWCISAEVYGWDADTGAYNQYVGEQRTLDQTPEDGVTFNYTLIDEATGLWYQSARDATTDALLAEYQKTSPSMTMVNTAIECQDCTPPTDPQYWENMVITLSSADENFASTLYNFNQATNTEMYTKDGGVTWNIEKVTLPAIAPIAQ